jgi:hypothetical protein
LVKHTVFKLGPDDPLTLMWNPRTPEPLPPEMVSIANDSATELAIIREGLPLAVTLTSAYEPRNVCDVRVLN